MASTHHHSCGHPIVVVTIDDEAFGHCCWVPSDHLQEHLAKAIATPDDRLQLEKHLADALSGFLLRQMAEICDGNAVIELLVLELKSQLAAMAEQAEQSEQAVIAQLLLDELIGERQLSLC